MSSGGSSPDIHQPINYLLRHAVTPEEQHMKRSKFKQQAKRLPRLTPAEVTRLIDALEQQLAESNKHKRIATKTLNHN